MSRSKDSTPNEHGRVGIANFNNESYATDNKYGQDLSGITYKKGISDHFGGDGSIGGNDVKRMMDAGYSSDDIYNFSKKKGLNYNKHGREYLQKEGDYDIGKGSDQWGDVFGAGTKQSEAKETAQAVKAEPPEKTEESVEKAQDFKEQKTQQVQQIQQPATTTPSGGDYSDFGGQNRTFGNNQNTIGDNNEIFGNVNQGNQDFSVNIAGGGNKSDGGMSNMAYGAAAKASMENSYNRDRATFNAGAEAAKYARQADAVTGASNRIKALDTTTDMNIDYFRKASDRATLGLYGDIWNMKAPTWKAPGELDPIEVTYNKDTEEEKK
jgi:hypothetical protein